MEDLKSKVDELFDIVNVLRNHISRIERNVAERIANVREESAQFRDIRAKETIQEHLDWVRFDIKRVYDEHEKKRERSYAQLAKESSLSLINDIRQQYNHAIKSDQKRIDAIIKRLKTSVQAKIDKVG